MSVGKKSEADTEPDERAERRKRARLLAYDLLRAEKTPEQVIERLRRDGFSAKEAERAVARADDRLQHALEEGERAKCARCGAALVDGALFCEACGAKVPDAVALHYHRTQIEPYLVKGRKWLGGMAILYALGGIAFGVLLESALVFAINMVLAAIQFGLWRWAQKRLLPAAVSSLVLFLTLHLVEAVADPASIFRGILIKALFIIALSQAIRAGLEARAQGTGAVA